MLPLLKHATNSTIPNEPLSPPSTLPVRPNTSVYRYLEAFQGDILGARSTEDSQSFLTHAVWRNALMSRRSLHGTHGRAGAATCQINQARFARALPRVFVPSPSPFAIFQMPKPPTPNFDTLSLHGQQPDPTTGARTVPIYQTASYVFRDTDSAVGLFNIELRARLFKTFKPHQCSFRGAYRSTR